MKKILLPLIIVLFSCDVETPIEDNFVVEAFLFQGEKVDDVKIKKTQLWNSLDSIDSYISDAEIKLFGGGEEYTLSYNSSDIENNQYFINSESGIMSENGTEFMMNKVNAKIILNDDSEIIIFSDKAIYNNINYNTKFYGNVIAKYREQTIFSENINLDFEIKLVTIYKNVLFQNLQTEIKTDKIEFDLMTKNILMFMDDKENKIKLKSSF